MNKVFLTGRLVAAPELKTTSNGKRVADFTVATRRIDGSRGADFIRCSAWGAAADNLCKYTDKGDWVDVDGSLRIDSYTGSDGGKRFFCTVCASRVEYISNRGTKNDAQTEDASDDYELPF